MQTGPPKQPSHPKECKGASPANLQTRHVASSAAEDDLRPDHRLTEPPKLEREETDDVAQSHAGSGSSLSPEYLELKNL
jgi:hypothetical protein